MPLVTHSAEDLVEFLRRVDPSAMDVPALIRSVHRASAGVEGARAMIVQLTDEATVLDSWSSDDGTPTLTEIATAEVARLTGVVQDMALDGEPPSAIANRQEELDYWREWLEVPRQDELARATAEFEADQGPDDPTRALVQRMNDTHCAVLDGGAFQVFREGYDDVYGRKVWTRMSKQAFKDFYEDETVTPFGAKRPVGVAELWLSSPNRRKYDGIVMDPDGRPENAGKLNLWRGWGVEGRRTGGSWSMLDELIGDVLCDRDGPAHEYVVNWIAYMLQNPSVLPEAAIAFRGEEGTGKGTLGRVLMRVAGEHGLTVASTGQLAGRFNSHLRNVVFLFADEAFWPGHKEGEGTLKQLVTEPVISFEAKGKDIVPGRNMVHLMLASNEDWVVPAGPTSRRFFVSDVSSRRRGDRAWFGRLWAQLEEGGYEQMVHDLSRLDIGAWTPSMIPHTEALGTQRLLSLDPLDKWWLELLKDGDLPVPVLTSMEGGDRTDWKAGAVRLLPDAKDAMVAVAGAYLERRRLYSRQASHKALVNSGKRFGLSTARVNGNRDRAWTLPPLSVMRERFCSELGVTDLFDE